MKGITWKTGIPGPRLQEGIVVAEITKVAKVAVVNPKSVDTQCERVDDRQGFLQKHVLLQRRP